MRIQSGSPEAEFSIKSLAPPGGNVSPLRLLFAWRGSKDTCFTPVFLSQRGGKQNAEANAGNAPGGDRDCELVPGSFVPPGHRVPACWRCARPFHGHGLMSGACAYQARVGGIEVDMCCAQCLESCTHAGTFKSWRCGSGTGHTGVPSMSL